MAKSVMDIIALILVIIGAINWGLIGVGLGNVVKAILGMNVVTDIVYILVGLAGLWTIKIVATK